MMIMTQAVVTLKNGVVLIGNQKIYDKKIKPRKI
jgi:hypothetical protein